MYTWVPIYTELAAKLLLFRNRQKDLLKLLAGLKGNGVPTIFLDDYRADGTRVPLEEIDPFTFFASFNRGITDENRIAHLVTMKEFFGLAPAVPGDFEGIPLMDNQRSWFFAFAKDRQPDDIESLWKLAAHVCEGGPELIPPDLFARCIDIFPVGVPKLTIGMFWMNPRQFLPADSKTTAYGKAKGITTEPKNYQSYRRWLKEMTDQFGDNYPQISHAAHLFATQSQSQLDLTPARMQMLWERFHKRIKEFTDFQNPGANFVNEETAYKRAILKKFQQEVGAEKLSTLVAQGQGTKAAKEIIRVLTSNLVSFHAWNITLGTTDETTCDVVRECLKTTSGPYQGPESTSGIFEVCARHDLKPNWDALSVLLWALRPVDFFPIKISFYRKLSAEVGHELPAGRPDADKLHSLMEFGRAFWKAVDSQKPTDWVDVQSFIWCVCPDNYQGQAEEGGGTEDGSLHESPPDSPTRQYWVFSPGTDAEEWEEFYSKGIMAIGWDELQDLRRFKSQEEISQKLQKLRPSDTFPTMNSLACWEFVHEIKIGDIIFVNQGRTKLIGYGVVEGDYDFDATRPYFKNVRKVNWLAKGEWEMPEGETKVHAKTLTGMTDPERIAVIARMVGLKIGAEAKPIVVKPPLPTGIGYWWLNANPKIWDFRTAPVGSLQTYTSHNEAGNKRQKFKHFAAVKPGDLLIGYVTTPDKEIIALCEITKALHGPPGNEAIEFRKKEQFAEPVTWAELQSVPALSKCEPILSNQGSLFSVTADEYDAIRGLIDERNIGTQLPQPASFTKADALAGLFMSPGELDAILARLKRKKALILQGPPGVGKTFIAPRLAFALMGKRDARRVAMIQFHPSYGYEDFVQGFRPTRTGLERRDGVFYQFARLARNDPKRDWFFIIDEINRGNLAKIFGELLMLIEADKRGPAHAIPLTYSEGPDETFYLPANLHFIGTMNTADRSLAMVDYALRRRFAFVTLDPALDSPGFADWLKERNASDALIARIRAKIGNLNEVIEKERDLGPGFRIGHSFFCPPDGHSPDEAWYREVIAGEIQPLLEEYFDSRERVEKLVAELLA